MTRTLLCGRAGSGKTHHCVGRLAAALQEGRQALLLVPTYGQAEHLRLKLVEPMGGFRGHPVLTFSSLAEHVLGLRLGELVSAPQRDRVAAEVLADFFPEAARKPGFRAEFLSTVKEIRAQGLSPDACLDKARSQFEAGSREELLFAAFARYVEALPGPDHEELLLRTRDALAEAQPKLDLLLVDGFHDFTPIERQILDLLAAGAGETVLTLPLDIDHPAHPVFVTAATTAASFEGYRREPLRRNHRAADSLAELERTLFVEPGEQVPAGDAVEVLACASDEDEADRLARFIARAQRPFRDFLIVRRSFDGLHALYRAAFDRHGIPLRFFGPEPANRSPAARAAALWLRLLAGGARLRDLLPLFRSPYLLDRPPVEEVDALANTLRDSGEPEDLDAYPSIRALVDERTGALASHWPRIGIRDALVAQPDGDGEIARAHRLFGAVEAEVAAVADLPLAEAAERVLRRIPLLRSGSPDRRHACVYAVQADEARQWEKPVVLVAGLGVGSFPRRARQDLFLRDEDRESLANERDIHLPLRATREEEERYLFYVALTRARERMVLSYAAFDEEGTATPPSPYLEEAVTHLEGVTRRTVPLAEQYVQASDASRREDLLPIVADGLARAHREEAALATALHDRGAVPLDLLAFPRRLKLARALPLPWVPAGTGLKLSASSINRYLKCPYLFLIDKLLEVRSPREHELDPLLRGNIVHEVLEKVARREGEAGEIFEEVFERETARFRLGIDDDAQRRWMRMAVLKTAERMRNEPVAEAERKFAIDVGEVRLRGKIDRVDRYDEGVLVRDYKTGTPELKDTLAFRDVQLDTYLLADTNAVGAVFERLKKGDRTGFATEPLSKVVAGRGKLEVLTPGEIDARRERMRALVGEVSRAIRAGALAVQPRDPENCTRGKCDGFDLCRVARARWLEKVGREGEGS